MRFKSIVELILIPFRAVSWHVPSALDQDLTPPAREDVAALLESTGFSRHATPVLIGAIGEALEPGAPARQLIEALIQQLQQLPRQIPKQAQPFLMPIEDTFDLKHRGVVVVGQISRGTIRVGDPVELVGFDDHPFQTMIRGLQMRSPLSVAMTADNVGCLLGGVDIAQVRRGQILAAVGTLHVARSCTVLVYYPQPELVPEQMNQGAHVQCYLWTTIVEASLRALGEPQGPGWLTLARLTFRELLPVEPGVPFMLRDPAANQWIGFALVVSREGYHRPLWYYTYPAQPLICTDIGYVGEHTCTHGHATAGTSRSS